MLTLLMATEPHLLELAADEPADDSYWVKAASMGDRDAFTFLYQRHSRRVFSVLWRLCGGHQGRAEDLLQESFIKAWQALPNFRFESAFSSWLHRLAVNTALMELRSRKGHQDLETDDSQLADIKSNDGSHRQTRLQMDLEAAVALLPERARAVLVLFDVEGWSHEDIAQELNMAVGSSKAQLHRARNLLRKHLGDYDDEV
jgi:RNA polymerase sigma factor (sigma-70 family)